MRAPDDRPRPTRDAIPAQRPARRRGARPTGRWADPLRWVHVALAAAVLVFVPQLMEQFEAPKAAVVRALGLGALAAGLASARDLGRLRWRALDVAVAFWLAVETLSTVFSVAPRMSLLGDTEQHEGLLTSLGLAGLYLATRWGAGGPGRARTTLQVGVAAAAVASAYAIVQACGLDPIVWARTAVYDARGSFMRPFGTLGHPNVLGVVNAAALGAALPLALRARRRRWLLGLAALVLGVATLLTLSRAAWLGTVAGVLVAAVAWSLVGRRDRAPGTAAPLDRGARRHRTLVAAVVIAAAAAVVALAGGMLRARFAELLAGGIGSGRSRLEIWRTALAVWRARPWLGHGPDTFALVFQRYQTPAYWQAEWATLPAHAHSIYLHALATRGALGLASHAGLALGLLQAIRAAWRASAAARALLPPLLALLASGAVAGAFGALGLAGALFVTVAAAVLASLDGSDPPAAPPAVAARAGRNALRLGAVTAALAVLWCAGDLLASHAAFLAMREWPFLSDPASAARAAAAADRAVAIRPLDDATARLRAQTFLSLAELPSAPREPLDEAEASARRAIGLEPRRALNQQTLGNVLMERARRGAAEARPAAEAAYGRCLALAPYNALAMLQLAREEAGLGRPQAALPLARRAVRLYPRSGLAQVILAEASLGAGDADAARRALALAVAGDWPEGAGGRQWAQQMLDSLSAGGADGRREAGR